MTDEQVQQILEEIIDLAHLIGWTSALAQDKNNQILGMYLGDDAWIKAKLGSSTTITH